MKARAECIFMAFGLYILVVTPAMHHALAPHSVVPSKLCDGPSLIQAKHSNINFAL